MSPSGVMWVEKYRPQKISELVNQKEIVGSINSMLKNQSELPHLLFSGSAGVGKTTAALCVSREILGEHWRDYTLELNASDERGINMVRERVKKFSRFAGLDTEKDAIKPLDPWMDLEEGYGLQGYRKATDLKYKYPDLKVKKTSSVCHVTLLHSPSFSQKKIISKSVHKQKS